MATSFAGRRHGRVEQLVLDAHVDVQLDHQLIDAVLTFGCLDRRRRDLLAQGAQDVVVLDQHLVGLHPATPVPTATAFGALSRTSIVPSRTRVR